MLSMPAPSLVRELLAHVEHAGVPALTGERWQRSQERFVAGELASSLPAALGPAASGSPQATLPQASAAAVCAAAAPCPKPWPRRQNRRGQPPVRPQSSWPAARHLRLRSQFFFSLAPSILRRCAAASSVGERGRGRPLLLVPGGIDEPKFRRQAVRGPAAAGNSRSLVSARTTRTFSLR
jgi:hypothetical protein